MKTPFLALSLLGLGFVSLLGLSSTARATAAAAGSLGMLEDCPNTGCTCKLDWVATVEHNPPPACVNASSVVFAFTGSRNDGCCITEGCNLKECKFKASVSVAANAGQTCDFRIVPPVGDGVTEVCSGAANCAFASSLPQLLNCGHSQNYQIKVGGVLIWSASAKCKQCDAA